MLDQKTPPLIDVVELAIDSMQGQGTVIEITEPTPFYTFLYFNCPIVLLDQTGCREWPAGANILYAPENVRYVRADSSPLLSTWFHASGAGVIECLETYDIPINTVLDLGELPFVKPILEEIRRERTQKLLHWEDAVSDLVRKLFRKLSDVISDSKSISNPAQKKSERLLRDIRMRVHSDLSHRWTLAEMADLGHLHPAWFGIAYKKQFGLTPIDDLLEARLRHAEALLRHLPMTVTHIAADCGFPSVEHFTRLFHQRIGCTPSEIRKQARK